MDAHKLWLLGATLTAFAATGWAQSPNPRSPFLPPGNAAAPAPTEEAPLQFCGYIGEGDRTRYCVYDSSTRRSLWLRVGEEGSGAQVQSFDPESRTITVAHNGRVLTLKLQTAKLAANAGPAGASPLPVAGQTANTNNTLVNSVVANPTPADEAKRLEAVAAEVRRRRALRQAAQNQAQSQGSAASPQTPR
ncbi:MAG TPA: hypothetical protein VHF69_09755 [Candidatus Synoicihabitans sp.]|nr:hypothetical protein [Candidatus Synoicihabitans sp.]